MDSQPMRRGDGKGRGVSTIGESEQTLHVRKPKGSPRPAVLTFLGCKVVAEWMSKPTCSLFRPLHCQGMVGFGLLVVRVPLNKDGRDVVAIVAATMLPSLAAGTHQKVDGLLRPLEAELLCCQVADLLPLQELPDAVRGDNGIPLIRRLHQELVVLRLPQHPVARGVAECSRHRQAWEIGTRQIDAVAARVDLTDLAAAGLQPRLLLRQFRLVVLGAEDHPRVSPVPGAEHDTRIADKGDVHRLLLHDHDRARSARGLDVDVVQLAELAEVLLRVQEGILKRLLPVLAIVLAFRNEVGQGLHQAEGHEVPERPMPIRDAVHGDTVLLDHEEVVLVRSGVGSRLLPLLADDTDIRARLDLRRAVAPVELFVAVAHLHRLGVGASVDDLIHGELLAKNQTTVHHHLGAWDLELRCRRDQGRNLEVLCHFVGKGLRLGVVLLYLGVRLDVLQVLGGPLALADPHLLLLLGGTFMFVVFVVVVLRELLQSLAFLRGRACDGVLVLLVLADVPLQEARERAEHPNEGGPGDVQASARADRVDSRLARLATEQRDLAEVVADGVRLDLDLALVALDAGDGLAGQQDEHLVVPLALLDNSLVVFELLLFEDLCQGPALVIVEHLEDVDAVQELDALLELRL
mmetsp:Transcript_199/g.840  ORF Transcript_199/g.840 Transcript_199/m.840 type:complete len:634 (+) Transcript_199:34-1935(+)